MKKTRRIAAMVAAMALTATMAVPSMMMTASATNVSIDTSNDNAAHTYSAYQIFKGTYDGNLGLTITGYGDEYDGNALAADDNFKALVISGTETVGSFLGIKTDAASVAQAIEKLNYTSGSVEADALAKILQSHIKSNATATTLSNSAVDLDAGYWIVLDSYTADADEGAGNVNKDAVSKYVLRVTGGNDDIQIKPKKDYPTVFKKVKENTNVDDYTYTVGTTNVTDADYNDVADYNIGDSVPFKLYGTMPSTYDDYNHYYYLFTDTLGTEFTMPNENNVKVYAVNPDADNDNSPEISDITSSATINISNNSLTVEFEDTKNITSITKDTVITVEYNAVLNGSAKIGLSGQENKVDLTYSNNPNKTGDGSTDHGDTDKTPEDKVIVFTYEQDIKKADTATGAALENAVFNLYKNVTEDVSGTLTDVKYYVQVDSNNKVTGWTKVETEASELKTGADGICKVIGLDDGTYYLKEKTSPDGYNKIDTEMTLAIDATTVNGQNWTGTPGDALTGITLAASGNNAISDITNELQGEAASNKGTVMAKVNNDKGVKLPETGGIGTTLFILGGGVTAAVAGIYLVSKKRAKDSE